MKNLFKNIFTVLFAFAILSPLSAEISKQDALAILSQADKNTNYSGTDFKGDYAIVSSKPGSGKSMTNATMFRRDASNMFTILITGPEADRGKGYVQFDSSIWFFDPKDKQFTYTSAKNRFQNTNLNNSDFIPQTISKDYEIQSFSEVKLGQYNCIFYELKSSKKSVDYPIIKLWVSKDDGLIRKKEDYSLSGQLLRTTLIPNYQKVEGRSVPGSMLIVDNLRGTKIDGKIQYEKTQITISNISFQKQPNIVYSKQYLEEKCD